MSLMTPRSPKPYNHKLNKTTTKIIFEKKLQIKINRNILIYKNKYEYIYIY